MWFVASPIKLSIVPALGASFNHLLNLKLELPHHYLRYFKGEQGSTTSPLDFLSFCFMKRWKENKRKDFFSSIVLFPPSSLCVVLLLGIVLCKLQEHEVELANLVITSKGEQNLPNPHSPLVFSFLCLHFVGNVCVDLTIVSRRRWTRPTPHPFHFFRFYVGIFHGPLLCGFIPLCCLVHVARVHGGAC